MGIVTVQCAAGIRDAEGKCAEWLLATDQGASLPLSGDTFEDLSHKPSGRG